MGFDVHELKLKKHEREREKTMSYNRIDMVPNDVLFTSKYSSVLAKSIFGINVNFVFAICSFNVRVRFVFLHSNDANHFD